MKIGRQARLWEADKKKKLCWGGLHPKLGPVWICILVYRRQGILARLIFRWGNAFKFLESIGKGIAVVKATFLGNGFYLEMLPIA